ncbi:hypothetical protein GMRT_12195 [Giardia muris]|uniref:Non-specific serine/threonine protein kinase n=1 Tax=Giardia muris TaxID=5742 RepID=A0A4Z1T1K6_GIAMU|nr:hypothetical protein GMRT_12195 [Giardia muris]|eukprot:TNJ27803.1 hypothetical protein GMRT_12195 [Giardia muris]
MTVLLLLLSGLRDPSRTATFEASVRRIREIASWRRGAVAAQAAAALAADASPEHIEAICRLVGIFVDAGKPLECEEGASDVSLSVRCLVRNRVAYVGYLSRSLDVPAHTLLEALRETAIKLLPLGPCRPREQPDNETRLFKIDLRNEQARAGEALYVSFARLGPASFTEWLLQQLPTSTAAPTTRLIQYLKKRTDALPEQMHELLDWLPAMLIDPADREALTSCVQETQEEESNARLIPAVVRVFMRLQAQQGSNFEAFTSAQTENPLIAILSRNRVSSEAGRKYVCGSGQVVLLLLAASATALLPDRSWAICLLLELSMIIPTLEGNISRIAALAGYITLAKLFTSVELEEILELLDPRAVEALTEHLCNWCRRTPQPLAVRVLAFQALVPRFPAASPTLKRYVPSLFWAANDLLRSGGTSQSMLMAIAADLDIVKHSLILQGLFSLETAAVLGVSEVLGASVSFALAHTISATDSTKARQNKELIALQPEEWLHLVAIPHLELHGLFQGIEQLFRTQIADPSMIFQSVQSYPGSEESMSSTSNISRICNTDVADFFATLVRICEPLAAGVVSFYELEMNPSDLSQPRLLPSVEASLSSVNSFQVTCKEYFCLYRLVGLLVTILILHPKVTKGALSERSFPYAPMTSLLMGQCILARNFGDTGLPRDAVDFLRDVVQRHVVRVVRRDPLPSRGTATSALATVYNNRADSVAGADDVRVPLSEETMEERIEPFAVVFAVSILKSLNKEVDEGMRDACLQTLLQVSTGLYVTSSIPLGLKYASTVAFRYLEELFSGQQRASLVSGLLHFLTRNFPAFLTNYVPGIHRQDSFLITMRLYCLLGLCLKDVESEAILRALRGRQITFPAFLVACMRAFFFLDADLIVAMVDASIPVFKAIFGDPQAQDIVGFPDAFLTPVPDSKGIFACGERRYYSLFGLGQDEPLTRYGLLGMILVAHLKRIREVVAEARADTAKRPNVLTVKLMFPGLRYWSYDPALAVAENVHTYTEGLNTGELKASLEYYFEAMAIDVFFNAEPATAETCFGQHRSLLQSLDAGILVPEAERLLTHILSQISISLCFSVATDASLEAGARRDQSMEAFASYYVLLAEKHIRRRVIPVRTLIYFGQLSSSLCSELTLHEVKILQDGRQGKEASVLLKTFPSTCDLRQYSIPLVVADVALRQTAERIRLVVPDTSKRVYQLERCCTYLTSFLEAEDLILFVNTTARFLHELAEMPFVPQAPAVMHALYALAGHVIAKSGLPSTYKEPSTPFSTLSSGAISRLANSPNFTALYKASTSVVTSYIGKHKGISIKTTFYSCHTPSRNYGAMYRMLALGETQALETSSSMSDTDALSDPGEEAPFTHRRTTSGSRLSISRDHLSPRTRHDCLVSSPNLRTTDSSILHLGFFHLSSFDSLLALVRILDITPEIRTLFIRKACACIAYYEQVERRSFYLSYLHTRIIDLFAHLLERDPRVTVLSEIIFTLHAFQPRFLDSTLAPHVLQALLESATCIFLHTAQGRCAIQMADIGRSLILQEGYRPLARGPIGVNTDLPDLFLLAFLSLPEGVMQTLFRHLMITTFLARVLEADGLLDRRALISSREGCTGLSAIAWVDALETDQYSGIVQFLLDTDIELVLELLPGLIARCMTGLQAYRVGRLLYWLSFRLTGQKGDTPCSADTILMRLGSSCGPALLQIRSDAVLISLCRCTCPLLCLRPDSFSHLVLDEQAVRSDASWYLRVIGSALPEVFLEPALIDELPEQEHLNDIEYRTYAKKLRVAMFEHLSGELDGRVQALATNDQISDLLSFGASFRVIDDLLPILLAERDSPSPSCLVRVVHAASSALIVAAKSALADATQLSRIISGALMLLMDKPEDLPEKLKEITKYGKQPLETSNWLSEIFHTTSSRLRIPLVQETLDLTEAPLLLILPSVLMVAASGIACRIENFDEALSTALTVDLPEAIAGLLSLYTSAVKRPESAQIETLLREYLCRGAESGVGAVDTSAALILDHRSNPTDLTLATCALQCYTQLIISGRVHGEQAEGIVRGILRWDFEPKFYSAASDCIKALLCAQLDQRIVDEVLVPAITILVSDPRSDEIHFGELIGLLKTQENGETDKLDRLASLYANSPAETLPSKLSFLVQYIFSSSAHVKTKCTLLWLLARMIERFSWARPAIQGAIKEVQEGCTANDQVVACCVECYAILYLAS